MSKATEKFPGRMLRSLARFLREYFFTELVEVTVFDDYAQIKFPKTSQTGRVIIYEIREVKE